MQLKI
jgi:hypothetical protein